jgi:hypothetical protein
LHVIFILHAGTTNTLRLKDYVFPSPSQAAAVMLGCSSNGRAAWKNGKETTLVELQEREAGEHLKPTNL